MNSEVGEVFYEYGSGLYANITNRCPCRCEFCIRGMTDGLGNSGFPVAEKSRLQKRSCSC